VWDQPGLNTRPFRLEQKRSSALKLRHRAYTIIQLIHYINLA
jgi:hypothetical protein